MAGSSTRTTNYNVYSVSNAVSILELLGQSEHEQSVAEIQDKLELTMSNTEKLLATLDLFGYVERNPNTGNYNLGVKTFQVSRAYINKINVLTVAMPLILDFGSEIDESISVCFLKDNHLIKYPVYETRQTVKVISDISIAIPNEVVCGKVLDENNTDIYCEYRNNNGVISMASAVFDYKGRPVMSILVIMPDLRADMVEAYKPKLVNLAKKISHKFGYSKTSAEFRRGDE